MSSGASYKGCISSILNNDNVHLFFEKDYKNTKLYLKDKSNSFDFKLSENTQYRKKYLN